MEAGSWVVRTITSPFRKGCMPFNPGKEKKTKLPAAAGSEGSCMSLQGEVKACPYKDVQVMWSILDQSTAKPGPHSS